ncbi:MAG: hypothetical protein ACYC6C_13055, partial [Coriobacteriia bacterium]
WVEQFAEATARATWLAHAYLAAVRTLQERWRGQLAALPGAPRRDAAAWAILDVLSAYPVLTATRRNRAWEAAGLLDLMAGLEAGVMPTG